MKFQNSQYPSLCYNFKLIINFFVNYIKKVHSPVPESSPGSSPESSPESSPCFRAGQITTQFVCTKRNHKTVSSRMFRCHSGFGPPPRIWTPQSKSASGYGPPGPNPLADMDPPSRFLTPLNNCCFKLCFLVTQ